MNESERRTLPDLSGAQTEVQSPSSAGSAADADPTCQVCGRAGSRAELLSWVMDRKAGRLSWTCPECAATNIRALEAKLEPEWW